MASAVSIEANTSGRTVAVRSEPIWPMSDSVLRVWCRTFKASLVRCRRFLESVMISPRGKCAARSSEAGNAVAIPGCANGKAWSRPVLPGRRASRPRLTDVGCGCPDLATQAVQIESTAHGFGAIGWRPTVGSEISYPCRLESSKRFAAREVAKRGISACMENPSPLLALPDCANGEVS